MERSAHTSAASENGGKCALPRRLGASDGALPDGGRGALCRDGTELRQARCKMIRGSSGCTTRRICRQLRAPLSGRSRKTGGRNTRPGGGFYSVCASGRIENALKTHGDGAQGKASRSGGRRADAAGDEKSRALPASRVWAKITFRQGARQRHAPFHAVRKV